MKKVKVITDSNSGMTREEADELGVFIQPMPFVVGGREYFEGVNLSQTQFYELLESDVDLHTSQPDTASVTELWERALDDCDEVVYIPMSSALSDSCKTASALAKSYRGKVQVVDNHRISFTMRQSVRDAVTLRNKGLRAAEIKKELERTKADSSIYIALDTLKYLKKGGRLTPAAALIGTIFRIKPVLTIQGGKLDAFKKVQTMRQAREAMRVALLKDIETRFCELRKNGDLLIGVAHTNNEQEAERFKEELSAIIPDVPVAFVDPLALSIACHIGSGSLACGCVRKLK